VQGTLEFPYGLTDWWEAGHAKIAVNKLQLGKLSFHQTKVFASVECPHLTFWTFNQEILANPVILIDNNPLTTLDAKQRQLFLVLWRHGNK
jgi:hypothetical protein